MALNLPDFPWDELDQARAKAASHPGGLIDLSVGSPVDPTPRFIAEALSQAGDSHGYPTVFGSDHTRQALARWWAEVRGASAVSPLGVMPTIGSKEMVGLLPLLLGLGPSDTVVIPTIAYPTYEVGAKLVQATVVAEDDPTRWPDSTRLAWLNSPSNPTGQVASAAELKKAVVRARQIGAVLASDECYALLGSAASPTAVSLLADEVTDGDLRGLLALYSLSKQSNMAGYRAAMIAGDEALIRELLLPRRHLGLITPEPIQRALVAAVADSAHVESMRTVYQRRRATLQPAMEQAGWQIDGGEAGLYLWATRGTSSAEAVEWCASRGLLVAPGHFYGEAGASHVRVALTASDQQIAEAATRFTS